MAFNSFLKFFKIDDEYEDDYDENDYEEYEEEPRVQARPRVERPTHAAPNVNEQPRRTSFLNTKSKVVPMNQGTQKLAAFKPVSFDESQKICDVLLQNSPAVVNLENFDPKEAQRVMDFISGCVYAIDGKYQQVSKYIFIFSPANCEIGGNMNSYDTSATTSASAPTIDYGF